MNSNWNNWIIPPNQNSTYFALHSNPLLDLKLGCEKIMMKLTNQEIPTIIIDDDDDVEVINKQTVELNNESNTSESIVQNQELIKNEHSEVVTNNSEDWSELNVKEDLSIYEEAESKNVELQREWIDWTELNIKEEAESKVNEQIPENNVETETGNREKDNLNNTVIDRDNNTPEQNSDEKQSKNKDSNGETQNKNDDKGNGNEKFKCEFCSYKTNWKGNLTKHVISRHTATEEIQWFECAHCPYKGKTKEYLKWHLSNVHDKSVKWHNCSHCPFRAKMKCVLDKHIIVNHIEDDKIKWFKCDLCPFKAKLSVNLKHHKINRHTALSDIKWYKCELCPFKAKHRKNLRLHKLNLHTAVENIQWVKCDKCPHQVKEKKNLKKHMERYHGEDGRSKSQQGGTKEIPVFIGNKVAFKRVPVRGYGCKCYHCVDTVDERTDDNFGDRDNVTAENGEVIVIN